MASDEAHEAGPSAEALSMDLQKLEDLIAREKKLEKGARDPENAAPAALGKLAPEQEAVRADTSKLREEDAARAGALSPSPSPSPSTDPKSARPGEPDEAARPGEGPGSPDSGNPAEPSDPADPSAAPREPGGEPAAPVRTEPPPAKPKPVLERKALERAEKAMAAARDAMEKGAVKEAGAKATEARSALEEAALAGKETLERLRARREWKKLKEEQEGTREDAEKIAARMQEAPPLVSTPEEGVPGKSDVEAAARDMQEASGSLGQGKAGKASKSQADSLDKLKTGREKTEAALEELQRALRERILAYLREKFTRMLNDQRVVSRETKSLDLKLRALRAAASADFPPGSAAPASIDRKDRLTAESLSARESAIAVLAEDVIDLLEEDGTTLVFPGVVVQIQGDLTNVSGLLSRIETGNRTQHIQREIEVSIEEILKALETAQKSPPPPNPNQGRSSKSGAGPLLPLSSELKMVRSLQKRVNERTTAFDLARKGDAALSPEEKLQVHAIAKKQGEVEDMLRKLKTAAREP
ncbi:MAG TPA: hypothetical protein VMT52_04965 [Planctomycetota bacterium]|nr:hypothetical protein [Planctomycetota bacterium]